MENSFASLSRPALPPAGTGDNGAGLRALQRQQMGPCLGELRTSRFAACQGHQPVISCGRCLPVGQCSRQTWPTGCPAQHCTAGRAVSTFFMACEAEVGRM